MTAMNLCKCECKFMDPLPTRGSADSSRLYPLLRARHFCADSTKYNV
jgi:hypothetical protein